MNIESAWMIDEWIDEELKTFLSRLHHPTRHGNDELEEYLGDTALFLEFLWDRTEPALPPFINELVEERMEKARESETMLAFQFLDASYWLLEE